MSGAEFGQQFINALSLGSIYALVAIGLAMVFSILRLINFAHGEMLMIGRVLHVLLRGARSSLAGLGVARRWSCTVVSRRAHGAGCLPASARRA